MTKAKSLRSLIGKSAYPTDSNKKAFIISLDGGKATWKSTVAAELLKSFSEHDNKLEVLVYKESTDDLLKLARREYQTRSANIVGVTDDDKAFAQMGILHILTAGRLERIRKFSEKLSMYDILILNHSYIASIAFSIANGVDPKWTVNTMKNSYHLSDLPVILRCDPETQYERIRGRYLEENREIEPWVTKDCLKDIERAYELLSDQIPGKPIIFHSDKEDMHSLIKDICERYEKFK